MITHHPSATTLLSYAAGTLAEALGVVAATHIAQCPSCRHTVAMMEAVGGVLLDELPPEPLATDALTPDAIDQLLAGADKAEQAPLPILHPDLPAPLNRMPMGRWWPLAFGLRWRPLRVTGAAWGGLLLVQPGRSLPPHGHDGMELTCVLSGAFDDAGRVFAAGDLDEPEVDHNYPLVTVSKGPCLCVIASEGVRLRGVLGLAQRMIGL